MAEDTFPVPAIAPELVRELAATAAGFVESLNSEQRARALLAFDSEERHDWHYVPRRRPGLALREMDETQRAAALVLLRIALSEAGGSKALVIMHRETILKRSDPSENYDPLDYAFALYGDPRLPPPWAWSADGHHLSLHFTLVGETKITITPLFMGVAPLVPHVNEGDLDPVLLGERDLAFQVVRALEGQERERAIIADRAMGDILSGPGREESLRTPMGLPLGRLPDTRRDGVLRLVEEYLGRVRRELADAERVRLREAGIENLHFAWAGALDPGQPHYYRIHGPTLLLEYDNTQENANHIHTVWHDPGLSFGGDALRRALRKQARAGLSLRSFHVGSFARSPGEVSGVRTKDRTPGARLTTAPSYRAAIADGLEFGCTFRRTADAQRVRYAPDRDMGRGRLSRGGIAAEHNGALHSVPELIGHFMDHAFFRAAQQK